MRILLLSFMLTLSGWSHAQQKAKYYYKHSLVIGQRAFDQMLDIIIKDVNDNSTQNDSLQTSISPQQISEIKEFHQLLSEQQIPEQEVYSNENGFIFFMPAGTAIIKINLEKANYLKGDRFIENGKEVTTFNPVEEKLTKVVTAIKRTDSLKSIKGYECVLFLLTIRDEQEPNGMLAEENIALWATRSVQPALPVQAMFWLKKPVKELENYTPVVATISSSAFEGAKDVIVLDKIN